ncbi:MAG: zinc ribbon domain-containing protein [Spirochaetaceae bacterium]|nr:zinc ribbon domain-containing protein [Spirochaetaceae bacterium]
MPTYEYECKSCNHRFEIFQRMADEPLKECPECGKELRRLINGGGGIIFKGGGFYVTDKAAPAAKPAKDGGVKPSPDKPAAPCDSCPKAGSGVCGGAEKVAS